MATIKKNSRWNFKRQDYTVVSHKEVTAKQKHEAKNLLSHAMAVSAKMFWDNFHENDEKKEHICDIPDEELTERHKNVLCLIGIYDPISIGTLIAGKYYKDVWSSRSCSRKLSHLVGRDDYLDFYCGSSIYYVMNEIGRNNIHKDFEKMDNVDQANRR